MKFYICRHCGNVITKLTSAQVPVKCCGEEMQLLEAGGIYRVLYDAQFS